MARSIYYVIVENKNLGKLREIRGSDISIVEMKAKAQIAQWNDQWEQRQQKEQLRLDREIQSIREQNQKEKQRQQKALESKREQDHKQKLIAAKEREKEQLRQKLESLRNSADLRTQEAKHAIESIQGILRHTLTIDDAIDWETLKSRKRFGEKRPEMVNPGKRPPDAIPPRPELALIPAPIPSPEPTPDIEPSRESFQPKRTLMGKIIKSIRYRQDNDAESAYAEAMLNHAEQHATKLREHAENEAEKIRQYTSKANERVALLQDLIEQWQKICAAIETRNKNSQADYEQQLAAATHEFERELRTWEQARLEYQRHRDEENAKIDARRDAYFRKEPEAIIDYCEMVLSASQYPDNFPCSFDLEFMENTGILVVDYALPTPEHLPNLTEVKFVQSNQSFKESFLSEKAVAALYDEAVYQIALRTLHELFEADTVNALVAISLNGLVTSINKTTGNETTTCILSIQAKKEEFLKINLANVDPKACFKALKGIGSSKLHGMTAIAPILNISREDRRFVNSYDVADSIDSSTNLAAMDWEDFEHLIREVFAKEFSSDGCEVKVTQASRDGGVDAIAFNPDPIRGGKTVIQAKRYTNTVGVSAVRDLFGTVTHEGANMGILVTTADYGPDAYDFIAGKPLNLINGAGLLSLLEKHGHQARINIQEARQNR